MASPKLNVFHIKLNAKRDMLTKLILDDLSAVFATLSERLRCTTVTNQKYKKNKLFAQKKYAQSYEMNIPFRQKLSTSSWFFVPLGKTFNVLEFCQKHFAAKSSDSTFEVRLDDFFDRTFHPSVLMCGSKPSFVCQCEINKQKKNNEKICSINTM